MNIYIKLLARIEIAEIWEYIAGDSESRADSFVDIIDSKLKALSEQRVLPASMSIHQKNFGQISA